MSPGVKGRVAELDFTARCLERGLNPSFSSDPDSKYDVVVDNGRRLYRVQIKSAHRDRNSQVIHLTPKGRVNNYTPRECDFVAARVLDGRWFLFPIAKIRGRCSKLCLPSLNTGRPNPLRCYFEAWHLLLQPSGRARK